jgi:hypothetical protein
MICKKTCLSGLLSRFKTDALSGSLFLSASVMLALSLMFYLFSLLSA